MGTLYQFRLTSELKLNNSQKIQEQILQFLKNWNNEDCSQILNNWAGWGKWDGPFNAVVALSKAFPKYLFRLEYTADHNYERFFYLNGLSLNEKNYEFFIEKTVPSHKNFLKAVQLVKEWEEQKKFKEELEEELIIKQQQDLLKKKEAVLTKLTQEEKQLLGLGN